MSHHDFSFDLNENTYDWCVKSFHALRSNLGVNLKVHHDHGQTEQGDIFLFNHFARFETIVPPYIIHQATGAYCRTIADHALFEGNERVGSFMRSVGAVPNNMPGLLPFLAAEILSGRKVVIFPEGGMVKDRKVMNSEGEYNIYSRSGSERRKHHRGASVLALTLDIFKRRILTLQLREDNVRIERWTKALNMPSCEALLKAAAKPTVVVPGTITFYPLHIDENAFSRGAELWAKGLSRQFVEELIVESNILLKDTDMDIRLGEPLYTHKKWHWWERLLLERHFKKVSSLEDLFNLRSLHAEDWTERMLVKCISVETNRIRDLSMRALYTGITVNLSHVASRLIIDLVKRGKTCINHKTFHYTLYLALKKLQTLPGAHLHRSLYWPDRYRGLIDGHCIELDRFLDGIKSAGLIENTEDGYQFLSPLSETFEFDEVRLSNPILIYANEIAPLESVRKAIDEALIEADLITELDLAELLFDDEMRAHEWNRQHHHKPRHADINDKETATESGAPYLLLPPKRSRVGVLLIHGLLASPAEWSGYAHKLHDQGHAVLGVRLAGHGTSPWDLHDRKWREWLAAVERCYRILSAHCDQIVVMGFSSGGVLALIHASEWPKKLVGVASISAPLKFRETKLAFVPFLHGLNQLTDWLPMMDSVMPFQEHDSEHPHINYHSVPVPALYELQTMVDEMQNRLPEIQVPVLLIQADEDPVVHPDSVKHIYSKLATDCQLKWINSDHHAIVTDDGSESWDMLDTFMSKIIDIEEDQP